MLSVARKIMMFRFKMFIKNDEIKNADMAECNGRSWPVLVLHDHHNGVQS